MSTAPDLDDQRVIAAEVGSAEIGEPVRLIVGTDRGDCAFARGIVAEGGVRLSLLDAALGRWIASAGGARATREEVEPCEGLPPIDPLVVPIGGWAIGLRRPAIGSDRAGPFALVPIGEDGRWWHLIPNADGVGSASFEHLDAPPTRFAIRIDQRVVQGGSAPVGVSRGGATILDLPGEVSYAAVAPEGIAEIHRVGARLVVLGRSPGIAEGVLRAGALPPEPLRIEVGAPVGPSRGELAVPARGRRRVVVERAVLGWWIGDPGLLEVEADGRRMTLIGRSPGRTELVLLDDAGALVTVPIAIGD